MENIDNIDIIETDAEEYMVNNPSVITNDKTELYTVGMGPCVALGVVAIDEKEKIHRIIYHCPYLLEKYEQFEGKVEQYLKSIGPIKSLRAVLASLETFSEKILDEGHAERNKNILDRVNRCFKFWKDEHPDFKIPIIQSTELCIMPDGNIGIEPIENVQQELRKDREINPEKFNTIFRTENLDTETAYLRLKSYQENEYDEEER